MYMSGTAAGDSRRWKRAAASGSTPAEPRTCRFDSTAIAARGACPCATCHVTIRIKSMQVSMWLLQNMNCKLSPEVLEEHDIARNGCFCSFPCRLRQVGAFEGIIN